MWFSTADCVDLNVCDIQLSIVQNNNTMHVGTTIWESSLVFAKWLERQEVDGEFNHKTLREKRAIELGAGCGIAGTPSKKHMQSCCILNWLYYCRDGYGNIWMQHGAHRHSSSFAYP